MTHDEGFPIIRANAPADIRAMSRHAAEPATGSAPKAA